MAAALPDPMPAPKAVTVFSMGVISGVTGGGCGGGGAGGSVGGTSVVEIISFDDVIGASLEVSGVDVDSSGKVGVDFSIEELSCSLVVCGVESDAWVNNTDELICSVVNCPVDVGVFASLVDSDNVVIFPVVLCSGVVVDE